MRGNGCLVSKGATEAMTAPATVTATASPVRVRPW